MKKKVVIFVHKLQRYRIPIYNLLSKRFSLTVVCDNGGDFCADELKFDVVHSGLSNVGPFITHNKSVFQIAKEFDVVIALLNVRCIDLMALSLVPWRRFKVIYWGIGVAASYAKKFDSTSKLQPLRIFFAKMADAVIFYSNYPVERYLNSGLSREKIFVADNTVDCKYYIDNPMVPRSKMIFIGTLYAEKGVLELVDSYACAFRKIGDALFDLVIVGDGPERASIEEMVHAFGLTSKVKLVGAIFDDRRIAELFSESIVSISPSQAGLSVLTSMSNAVPFITHRDAITGGEIFNISDGKTGLILNSLDDLCDLLVNVSLRPEVFRGMGINAREYYLKERRPEKMAGAIGDAVDFVLRH